MAKELWRVDKVIKKYRKENLNPKRQRGRWPILYQSTEHDGYAYIRPSRFGDE